MQYRKTAMNWSAVPDSDYESEWAAYKVARILTVQPNKENISHMYETPIHNFRQKQEALPPLCTK